MKKPLKKILICYHKRPPIGAYLEQAFAQRDIEVVHYHPDTNTWFDRKVIHFVNKQLHNLRLLAKGKWVLQDHPLAHMQHLQTELGKVYAESQPDLFLGIRGTVFGRNLLTRMTCPKFGWWIESESRFPLALDDALKFDHYFCMSQTGVEKLRANGYFQSSYLGHAVDMSSFNKVSGAEKTIDLCFVGNYCPRRQMILEAALTVTKNVVIYGDGWASHNKSNQDVIACLKGSYIAGKDLNLLYNQSKVVLNVTSWEGQGALRSGMNMRLFEVPATGSLLLTDEIRELADFFCVGQHLLTYRDADDFRAQLKSTLHNQTEREDIALAGYKHVKTHYTYATTVEKIINAYNALE
ncbi:MAG: CgeB family protein [Fluviibacter sp.]